MARIKNGSMAKPQSNLEPNVRSFVVLVIVRDPHHCTGRRIQRII
jgi:hypothetical protein